jgi:predicted metal-dependent hydrolase
MQPPPCQTPLHPQARQGIALFNKGHYFEAHEALEAAWKNERDPLRDLYRGILQVAVVYHHILRGNYAGAIKVYQRSLKWLEPWPENCGELAIGQLRRDVEDIIAEVRRLGPDHLAEFDPRRLKPIVSPPDLG